MPSLKKSSWLIFAIAVLGLCLAGGSVGWWWQRQVQAVRPGSIEKVLFTVETGAPLSGVLTDLEERGLIRSARAAAWYLRINRLETKIQAGNFQLSPGQTLAEISQALQRGQSQTAVTIPEGYRREQIVGRLCRTTDLCPNGYPALWAELNSLANEGDLFPDTYFIDKQTTVQSLVAAARENRQRQVGGLQATGPAASYQEDEIRIIASLIEREALTDAERPVIAGILYNRLAAGWPLQVDATVQYLIGCRKNDLAGCTDKDWWPDISRDDLQTASSYNTYLNSGLPPQPICNPGLSSLRAAYQPEKTDYFYYLHDRQGSVHWAVSLAEHEQNIAHYLD